MPGFTCSRSDLVQWRNLIKICQWLLEIDICADRDVDLHVLGDLSFDMSSIKGGLTQIISASELNIASEETAAENEGSAEENLMLIETVGPDQIAEDVSGTVEKNGGLLNASTGANSDILIEILNGPKSDAAQAVKNDDEIEDEALQFEDSDFVFLVLQNAENEK